MAGPGTSGSLTAEARKRRGGWILAGIAISILLALVLTLGHSQGLKKSKGGGKKGGEGPAAVPVVAVRAKRGNIGVYFTGLGTVTPLNTVTERTRVDGELMQVQYREGDMVRKGDLLAQIDPRPFRDLEKETAQVRSDVQAAQRALELSTAQYQAGTASYLQVITSQAAELAAARGAVALLGRRLVAAVLLIEALGGGWDVSQLPPS